MIASTTKRDANIQLASCRMRSLDTLGYGCRVVSLAHCLRMLTASNDMSIMNCCNNSGALVTQLPAGNCAIAVKNQIITDSA